MGHSGEKACYWLCPVGHIQGVTALEVISRLVDQRNTFSFLNAVARRKVVVMDRLCFYAKGLGVVGTATVSSLRHAPVHAEEEWMADLGPFVRLKDVNLHMAGPIPVTLELRQTLDAFNGKQPLAIERWAWFVQTAHQLTEHDFKLLTQHDSFTPR